LLPVPSIVSGHSFDVVANNPGVVDSGLAPTDLQVRTVTINVRDSSGQIATGTVKVAQNFLLGYGVSFSPVSCPAPAAAAGGGGGGATPQACAGGQTAVIVRAVFNGNLQGNREFKFEAVKGPFGWVFPDGAVGNSITVMTDHTGTATAIMQVNAGVPTQVAVLRVTDVASGVTQDTAFVITGAISAGALTIIPNKFTFTGALSTQCGTGSGDFLVLDGTAPYSAISSSPNVTVSPSSTSANPGRFTINASNPNVCLTDATIIVTDAIGGRGTVTVSTALGSFTPPPAPTFTVAPTAVTLSCATSGSVSAVGGSGIYTATSTHPRVTALVSGNTITITRLATDPAPPYPTTATISVSDGSAVQTVTVTVPATCP
jgi:hypothetical protein